MDIALYNKLVQLKIAIENDERIKQLNILDEKLSCDEEVMKLAYQKDIKALEYENALKLFDNNSKEVKNAQKALYEIKFKLDSLEIVKQYNKAYKEVRMLYENINKELFSDFRKKSCKEND